MPYLSSFGIKEHQLFFNRTGVVCQNLIVATQGMIVRQSASSAARSVWEHWRRHVSTSSGSARIYISRANIPTRMLVNEEEVQKLFETEGFEVIFPEQLTFDQQIAAISNASHVAGPSGSNWFNIVFGNTKQSQLILTSENYIVHSEVLMRRPGGNRLRFVVGPAQNRGEVHSPWSVDIGKLASQLRNWLT